MSRSIGKWFLWSCALAAATLVPAVHAQTVTVLAGQGSSDADGVPATIARIRGYTNHLVAPDGTIYLVEQQKVRKITPNGTISTIVGLGGGYSSGIARDASGNIYIAQSGLSRIVKMYTSGRIETAAGTGVRGYSGDGGSAIAAELTQPSDMTFDASGNLFFVDSQRIRKITPTGIISTVAGGGPLVQGNGRDGDGGPATSAYLHSPTSLAFDSAGNMYIADGGSSTIRKVTPLGIISTYAGTTSRGFAGDGGAALLARFNFPNDLAIDSVDNLYVADTDNYRIRKIDTDGMITTVVGNGSGTTPVEGSLATSTGVNPFRVSLDTSGDLYIGHFESLQSLLVKVDMPAVSSPIVKTEAVEEEIVEAMDGGSISSGVANLLLDSLTPIQEKLAWIVANPSSPDLARVKNETCSMINAFNTQMDHYVRLRRLPARLRDEWKADMLEVKADLGCGN